jgi:hypothetical protein
MDDRVTEEELRRFATHLSRQRRTDIPGECAICGTPFVGMKKRRYCSHKCAQKAYMLRKGGK